MEDFQKKFILALLAYASQRGIEPQRLCELAGIDYKSILKKNNKPVSAELINSLWKNAAHLTSDYSFCPHFGESMQQAARNEYQRVLGCIVSRKVDEIWIEFPKKIPGLEILSANYEIQNHLLNQVSILMKANEADGPFHKKVYNYLLSSSFLYSLTLEAVAANFNMSVRSLQRKLKNEAEMDR